MVIYLNLDIIEVGVKAIVTYGPGILMSKQIRVLGRCFLRDCKGPHIREFSYVGPTCKMVGAPVNSGASA